jgi:hypothetical protein
MTVIILSYIDTGVTATAMELWSQISNDIRVYCIPEASHHLSSAGIPHITVTPVTDVNTNGTGLREVISHVAGTPTHDHILFVLADVWLVSPRRFQPILDRWISDSTDFLCYITQVGGRGYYYECPSTDMFGITKQAIQRFTQHYWRTNHPQQLVARRNGVHDSEYCAISHHDPRTFEVSWEHHLEGLSRTIIGDHPYHQYGYKFGIAHLHHVDMREEFLRLSCEDTGRNVTYIPDTNTKLHDDGVPYIHGYLRMIPETLDDDLHTSFTGAADSRSAGNYLVPFPRKL